MTSLKTGATDLVKTFGKSKDTTPDSSVIEDINLPVLQAVTYTHLRAHET